ncbi:MAG TPA: hypothetical protein VH814_12390 [Steroidobacteraceae bacterium]|jgi:hypothetical protein
MAFRLVCCLCLLIAAYAQPSHAERDWYETRTSNGVRIVSAVNAAETKKIAADVDLYFEALQRVLKRSKVEPLVPLNVLVLDRGLYKYVDPLGRTDGRFHSFPASAEILVEADSWQSNSATVFHELTHLLLRQSEPARALPPFYNEGMAELISTIKVKDGRLHLGLPPMNSLYTVQMRPRMPIKQVMTLGAVGDLNERAEWAAFYARSWLIVHHALFANPARIEQIARYRHLLLLETKPDAAFDAIFGAQAHAYEKELVAYASRRTLAYYELPIDSLSLTPADVRTLPAADGLNELARFLVKAERLGDPQLKFLRALAKNAASDSVAALQLAIALIARGQLTAAKPMVDAGCIAPTATRIAVLCGDALSRELVAQTQQANPSPDGSLARSARQFYEAALREDPANLEVLLACAATFSVAPADSSAVRAGLEAALQRNPNNSWVAARLSALYRPLDLLKSRDYMERAVLSAPDEDLEKEYAQELNRIGSELAAH